MSYKTYVFFRKEFLNDQKGKLMESDELFLNIYDFWVLKHAFFMHCKRWYQPKLTKLERILRRKWERAVARVKTLPIINVLILKITEEDRTFDPTKYLCCCCKI